MMMLLTSDDDSEARVNLTFTCDPDSLMFPTEFSSSSCFHLMVEIEYKEGVGRGERELRRR